MLFFLFWQAVKRTLKLSCKCHGVSGSCSIRTCWKDLSDFRVVGDYIKRKYFRAVMVDAQNGQLRKGNSAQRRDERDILQISKNDLVYLEASPDFCKNNTVYGTLGTVGRSCSRPEDRTADNRWERKSCNRLCKACGLKVKRVLVTETSTCNCRFHWCCEVKCESCTQVVEKFTCVSTWILIFLKIHFLFFLISTSCAAKTIFYIIDILLLYFYISVYTLVCISITKSSLPTFIPVFIVFS